MELKNRGMKTFADMNHFLDGTRFSNDLSVPLRQPYFAGDRTAYLVEIVKGKTVLHIGCVDHLPLVEQKINSNTWLHKNLQGSAKRCVGIDINKDGIDWLRQKGIPEVFYCDILNDALPSELSECYFDLVILGEMIEHVDSPIDFLKRIRANLRDKAKTLVVTTPNAFRVQNVVSSLKGYERINTDHRFWFTPYTIAKNLVLAGFSPTEIRTIWNFVETKKITSILKLFIAKWIPGMQDSLIAIAEFKSDKK
jgi:2-polyprenyl-3-methyl-5-hydroxy-6-metoxy-1,4-benzoquinol methylase